MQIKQILERNGMTQAELSRLTGMSSSHISDFVNGRRKPTIGSLMRLADALGCTTDTLLGRDTAEATP